MSKFQIDADTKSFYSLDKLSTKYSSDLSVLNFDNYVFKLLCFRSKIKKTLENITFLLMNGIIEPNGEEDFFRRIRRCKEFSVRFSRNFTYQINRNVGNLREFQELEANKVSSSFIKISIHTHNVIVQALDKFSLQLPNMIKSNHLPDYFVETLKLVCEVCSICCGVEIDTNGDCKSIELLNDIENDCKQLIVNKIPIFYRKETIREKRKRLTPCKPKNMLEMYVRKVPLRKTQSFTKRIKLPNSQFKRNCLSKSSLSKKSLLTLTSNNLSYLNTKSHKSMSTGSQLPAYKKDQPSLRTNESNRPKGPASEIETIMQVMKNKSNIRPEKALQPKPSISKYFIKELRSNRYDLSESGNDNAKLISIKIRNDFDKRKLENFVTKEKKKLIVANKEQFRFECMKINAYCQMGTTNAWSTLAKISDILVNDLLNTIMKELDNIIDQNVTEILMSEIR